METEDENSAEDGQTKAEKAVGLLRSFLSNLGDPCHNQGLFPLDR